MTAGGTVITERLISRFFCVLQKVLMSNEWCDEKNPKPNGTGTGWYRWIGVSGGWGRAKLTS